MSAEYNYATVDYIITLTEQIGDIERPVAIVLTDRRACVKHQNIARVAVIRHRLALVIEFSDVSRWVEVTISQRRGMCTLL